MIDLRSDTVSQPTDAMRHVIANAPVGDDVYGDDPTVNDLEAFAADLLGKDAAMFVPTGTQSNLCGLMAHCQRGDEYIVGDHAHTYSYEAGGAAVLGSIQPQPVRMLESGMIDLDHVRNVVKADDHHFARSRLLCVENTTNGKAIPLAELEDGAAVADHFNLSYHLDGARVFNAVVELDTTPATLVAPFDSISICLSKGLGAPIGSILVGNTEVIAGARKWRKMLGGGWRQAGLLAAAGRYALENNIDRLADDHHNAQRLADALAEIDGIDVVERNTNMAFANFSAAIAASPLQGVAAFGAAMKDHSVLLSMQEGTTRLVTHIGISEADIDTVIAAIRSSLAS